MWWMRIHGGLKETALARWRADHVGVVFQFFNCCPPSPRRKT